MIAKARPGWLVEDIRANARCAFRRRCPTCSAPVLTGLDADAAALTVTVDPQPIDALGEALAVLAGRATFEAWTAGPRVELEHRGAGRIAFRPAGTSSVAVAAAHRCGSPPPTAVTQRHTRPTSKELPDDPRW